ncbi:MarR family transcriptional regulator [Clostridium ljungdahlii]|uniref:Putative HTH-type transcriptional regulator n=1 Tax=Clostridium ljungdahlii TaxID=1538 RepID=A0A162KVY1_9CLOT|nr:putative HTH-type transcriptional regulator [Clostridium ljungdahlii]
MEENNNTLMELFSKAGMLLFRYQHHGGREQGAFVNPHRGQGRILVMLKMQPEISQKDLSYLLDMRNQSLSELLTKLEKAGFITRTQSETDRRVMDIKLTDEGKAAAEQAEQQKEDTDQLFEILSEEERKNLSDYLSRIIAELEKLTGGEPDFAMTPEMLEHLRIHGVTPEMQEHLKTHGITPEMIEQMRARGFDRRVFGRGPDHGGFGRGFGPDRTPHKPDDKPDKE